MFGYVCIDKAELKVKDYETYKSVYCGLCKQLGKDYFFLTRLILNYDLTFFALMCMSAIDNDATFKKSCCRFNPLKSCTYICTDEYEEALKKASSLLVIMAYYKVLDNIDDSGFFKKLGYIVAKPYFTVIKNRAAKRYPLYLESCEKMYSQQKKAEKERASVDEAAEPTARLLSEVFAELAADDKSSLAYSQFGYHLGKWIYLMDAVADIDEDIKHGSYNPIYEKLKKQKSECTEYARALLSQSMFLLTSAYSLIEKRRFEDILDNIVLIGLPKKQNELLTSRKEK